MNILEAILTGIHNPLDEIFPWNQAIVVLIHLPEEIRQPRLLVIHEFQELSKKMQPLANAVNRFKCYKIYDIST